MTLRKQTGGVNFSLEAGQLALLSNHDSGGSVRAAEPRTPSPRRVRKIASLGVFLFIPFCLSSLPPEASTLYTDMWDPTGKPRPQICVYVAAPAVLRDHGFVTPDLSKVSPEAKAACDHILIHSELNCIRMAAKRSSIRNHFANGPILVQRPGLSAEAILSCAGF